MPLIECKSGQVTESVGGVSYSFVNDKHGRAVCNVSNLAHAQCFLSIEAHYCLAEAEPSEEEPASPAALEAVEAGDNAGETGEDLTGDPEPEETAEATEAADEDGAEDGEGDAGDGDEEEEAETVKAPEDMTDDELRAHIEIMTGKPPHHAAQRPTLLKRYEEALAARA